MVAQALVITDHIKIEFPADQSVVSLDLDPKHKLQPGSVPHHIKQLKFCQSNAIEPGALGPSVTHVYLRTLTLDMHIPSTVEHLVIYGYDGLVPLPSNVPNVYIHASDAHRLKTPCVHFIYHWHIGKGATINQHKIDRSCCMSNGKQTNARMFDEDFTVLQMVFKVPKVLIEQPAPAPIIPSLQLVLLERKKLYLEAKLACINQELADMRC